MTQDEQIVYRDMQRAQRRVSVYFRTAEFYATADDYERRVLGMPLREWDQFYADFRKREMLRHYREKAEWFRFVEETHCRDFPGNGISTELRPRNQQDLRRVK